MPGFKVEIKHSLGQAEAVERLQGFSDKIKESYRTEITDIQESWSEDGCLDFSFKAMGFKISGNVQVQEESVSLNGGVTHGRRHVSRRHRKRNQIQIRSR